MESAVAENDVTAAAAEAESPAPKGNALAIYFSRVGNTDFPEGFDADSSASIRIDDNGLMGNAGRIAGVDCGGSRLRNDGDPDRGNLSGRLQ